MDQNSELKTFDDALKLIIRDCLCAHGHRSAVSGDLEKLWIK